MTIGEQFLTGVKVLEEVESPINGKITVLKSLAFGVYIQVEGLTQSGGVINTVWKTSLKKLKKITPEVKNCLILGLGGGSAANLVKKFWPEAEIAGVEIDPIMIDLGKRYLDLVEVETKIVDAFEYCKKAVKQGEKFDLILVDVYVGYEVPKRFETDEFARLARKLLAKDGVVIFNRLYFDEKRAQAVKFSKRLERIFSKVTAVYPEANVMFICA